MSLLHAAMDEYALKQKKTWKHDRTKTIGASEIGLCERRVWAVKKGVEPDPDYVETWGASMRGTVMENQFWQPALKMKYGKNFLWSGKDQTTLEMGTLSATPDGILINQKKDVLKGFGIKDMKADCLMVEAKSIDPRVNLSSAKHENMMQTMIQMGIVRAKTEYKPNYALISYTDASFWNEIDEYVIKFDPQMFKNAQGRANKIMATTRIEDTKPEGYIAGGKECEFCPIVKRCGVARRSFPEITKEADPQFVAEVSDMVRELQIMKEDVKIKEIKVKEQEEAIKSRLREKAVRKVPGLVTWSPVKGRESWDNKGIREAAIKAGVDVEAFMTTGDPTDRLQTFKATDELGG